LSSHRFACSRRMQMELHHFNMTVPGSSPGGVGNDVVAQMAEQHDGVSSPLVVAKFSSVLSKCATNAGGNYIGIRRSSGVSPGMCNRISSGESAGHRFLAHLSSRSIFSRGRHESGPSMEVPYGKERTIRRRVLFTRRPASAAEASRLRLKSSAESALFTATKS
jgi:hypothetical protein